MTDEQDLRLNALTRMGERVAALEARSTTEIAALKKDTEVIRSSMHDIGNTLQQFIATSYADRAIMQSHMKECTERSVRMEWYGRFILMTLIAVVAFLLEKHFWP